MDGIAPVPRARRNHSPCTVMHLGTKSLSSSSLEDWWLGFVALQKPLPLQGLSSRVLGQHWWSEFVALTEPSPPVSGCCWVVWSYRYGSFVVLLQVVSKKKCEKRPFSTTGGAGGSGAATSASSSRHLWPLPPGEVLFFTVNAVQPAVAVMVRVDMVFQTNTELLESRCLPVRLVLCEVFRLSRIWVTLTTQ